MCKNDYKPYFEAEVTLAMEAGIAAKLHDLEFSACLIAESEVANPKKPGLREKHPAVISY